VNSATPIVTEYLHRKMLAELGYSSGPMGALTEKKIDAFQTVAAAIRRCEARG
jgi:hypothetical protein